MVPLSEIHEHVCRCPSGPQYSPSSGPHWDRYMYWKGSDAMGQKQEKWTNQICHWTYFRAVRLSDSMENLILPKMYHLAIFRIKFPSANVLPIFPTNQYLTAARDLLPHHQQLHVILLIRASTFTSKSLFFSTNINSPSIYPHRIPLFP